MLTGPSYCGAVGAKSMDELPASFADDGTPDDIDVTTCSLADAAALGPEYHTYAGSALPPGPCRRYELIPHPGWVYAALPSHQFDSECGRIDGRMGDGFGCAT